MKKLISFVCFVSVAVRVCAAASTNDYVGKFSGDGSGLVNLPASGGASPTFENTQFGGAASGTNIIPGATLTNIIFRDGFFATNPATGSIALYTNSVLTISNGAAGAAGKTVISGGSGTFGGALTASSAGSSIAGLNIPTGSFSVTAGNISLGGALLIFWNGRSVMSSPSDGIVSIVNNATTGAGTIQASLAPPYFASASSMTLTATNGSVNFTGSTLACTLPTAVGITHRVYIVKASHATGLTIATTSSQTIEGTTPVALTVGQCRWYQSDGSNWWIIAGF